ncbi:MAG TPA: poly(3-hydroxybutyrate) depolymerase [Gammaproteobacteria bacterium]|nr:poly(3-hydroxybutyrate) depolymerase [Gammaproteobacteria bacterium]HIM04695.1 poly(3-hydroxybutyrate) depolymerase [Gammaproteobacteria bacterium]
MATSRGLISGASQYFSGLKLLTKVYLSFFVGLAGLVLFINESYLYDSASISPVDFEYPDSYLTVCAPSIGRVADHAPLKSPDLISYTVTTPGNYRSDFGHALLVVWAPSGFSEMMSERFTGLTRAATERGFVVVHVDSIGLSISNLASLGRIPDAVTKQWCIEPSLVFYTGHSDGGTVSNALAVMSDQRLYPRAIGPSAMGMQGLDMTAFACPDPTAVMLMHNQNDSHFPGFGELVAAWWADCNQCSKTTAVTNNRGCREYTGCAAQAPTVFCELPGNHSYWPGRAVDLIGFFSEVVEASRH